MRVCQAGGGPGHDRLKRCVKTQECVHTSLTAPAAAPPEGPGSTGPGGGLHCALIRSRSWVSSIPVPSSSCSRPAASAALVTSRASQELAHCSWRARAACEQPTRWGGGTARGEDERRVRSGGEKERDGLILERIGEQMQRNESE